MATEPQSEGHTLFSKEKTKFSLLHKVGGGHYSPKIDSDEFQLMSKLFRMAKKWGMDVFLKMSFLCKGEGSMR